MLVARLQRIANGEQDEPYQVTAAIALLRKVLPDLQATMISGDPQLPLTIITRAECECHATTARRSRGRFKAA